MTATPKFATVPDPAPPPRRYRLLTAEELADRPPMRWRIKGVLPESGLAAVIGASGSGKTFLVLDALAAIDAGEEWFGHQVRSCPVVVLALEGQEGVAKRISAYQKHTGHQLSDRFRVVTEPFSLLDIRDRPDLVETLREAGLTDGVVVVDTLNRAAPGADENSSIDMGLLIAACSDLQAQLGGLVLIVHHSGKDGSKGARGHSSLFAALDAVIEVVRENDARSWRITKSKDGEDGHEHPFKLQVTELGIDEDGDAITSCVVEPAEALQECVRKAKVPGGGNMRVAYDAISTALKASHSFGKASAPPTRPCITLEQALDAIGPRLPVEPKRQRERAQSAITGLTGKGVIAFEGGWLWLP